MWLKKTALVLAAIGAINWGLHAFDFGLIDLLFDPAGSLGVVGTILYVVIALCGIWALVDVFQKK